MRLEMSADIAVKWFRINNMYVNPSKFEKMIIRGRDITPVTLDVTDISILIDENVKTPGFILKIN